MTLARNLSAALVLLFGAGVLLLGSAANEHDVKAAYLVNVLRFAQPRTPGASKEFVLCLVSADALDAPLTSLEGGSIQGRKLRIRKLANAGIEGCSALFLGRSSGCEPVLTKANSLGILTIGNDRDFLPMGGMVALVVENRRLVIEINRLAIKGTEWSFSSHLLEIARVVSGAER